MAAVIDILNLALRDVGVIGEGQTASAETTNDALTTLNQMIGQWNAQKIAVLAQKEVSFAATGAQTYTIGVGGAVNTALPVKVDAALWRDGEVDYHLEVIESFEDYQEIGIKELSGVPAAIHFQRTFPLGLLYVYPQPSTGSIYLTVSVPLSSYATVADTLTVPSEYELAFRFSLAELLAITFSTPLRPDVAMQAAKARRIMKRNNVRIPQLNMPSAVLPHRGSVDIREIY